MKRFLFLTIAALLAIGVQAEDPIEKNHPHYYQDGDYWVQALVNYEFDEHLKSYESQGFHQDLSLYAFFVKGDTIIDQKEYKCVHARKWFYNGDSAFDNQPCTLKETNRIPNILFMREDANGKQWRRLNGLDDEALLFDFSRPFSVGQMVTFCRHGFLKDYNTYYVRKTSFSPRHSERPNGVEIWKSEDDAPRGYMYYDMEVHEIKDFEMPNGEKVPLANGHIAFGWGDIEIGDLWHQFIPDEESLEGRFLFRVHQGQVIIENKSNIQNIQKAIGMDITQLVKEDYRPFIEEGKRWYVGSFKGHIERTTTGNVYYFDGDTIIAGQTCKRWMRDGILVAPIFEEGRRVWFFRENEEEPRLLYDFGITKGEPVEASNLTGYTLKCYLDTITTDTCGRRFFHIYDDEGLEIWNDAMQPAGVPWKYFIEQYSYVWIEGIGTGQRPYYNIGLGGKYGNSDILTEVWVGDKIIYKNNFFKWIRDGVSTPKCNQPSKESSWSDLSGRRLSTPPTQKGIYIHQGKKVLIK